MDSVHIGGLGGTYGGNPLACAASLAVLEIIEKDDTLQHATEIGKLLMRHLKAMQDRYEIIGDVRGLGPMAAIELVKDRSTKEPAKEETGIISEECYKNGLVTISAGTRGNVIRFLMPVTITEEELEAGLGILETAIKKVADA